MKYPLITLGSPIGIGYEVFLKSIKDSPSFQKDPVFAIGSLSVLQHYCQLLNDVSQYQTVSINDLLQNPQIISPIKQQDFTLVNIDDSVIQITDVLHLSPVIDGKLAYQTILKGAELVQLGLFSSLVTLPVSKAHINLIDPQFLGHTEFLQSCWHAQQVFMTFISPRINVMLLTTHLPLEKVASAIQPDRLSKAIDLAQKLVNQLKLKPKICLLGLNPHAGESGLLGKEELQAQKIIELKQNQTSILLEGPIPADTAFSQEKINNTGLYIACYHDQGLIPFKMLSFDDGVNLSWGMPFIRTSVDHGTAVNLIGTKKASTNSFVNAYQLAKKLTLQ
ncbi:MAG: 4-hydroxythreonine-4-phosphate dehydrogenase PdxA [Spirochaetes bacterium]|nr:4-hydroxythreonine-4-phosphate dehydrogenase PdxA [Spirochaetota bacterium]